MIKIIPAAQSEAFEALWLQVCMHAGESLPPGLNPCVPAILQQVWHWPVVRAVFVRSGVPVALLAAMLIKGRWVSLPHVDQGGIWWDARALAGADAGAQMWLVTGRLLDWLQRQSPAGDYMLEADMDALLRVPEVPGQQPAQEVPCLIRCRQWLHPSPESGKVLSIIRLNPALEVMPQLPPGPARKVRKAIKNGVQLTSGGAELLPEFYRVYRRNIRRLGSFGLPLQFFETLLSTYRNGEVKVYVCHYRGRAVGASVLLTYTTCAENLWFASSREANKLYVSYLLHYGMMQDAQAAGCLTYSMGRSSAGGGVHRYKSQFGGESVPLYYNTNRQGAGRAAGTGMLRTLVQYIPLPVAVRLDKSIGRLFY